MHTPATQANPFALLMDPEAVFRTLETSGRLERLQRRVCRPLDKPLIPRTADASLDDLDDADDFRDGDESGDRLS
jgi:hypothetical protein